MKTVKVARLHAYGGAETVRIEEVSLPEPKPGELLVRVHAGVNPIDRKIRSGYLKQVMPLQLPVTLGGDFSGVVEAVGTDVADLKVGDEVYGQASVTNGGSGTFAEAVLARTDTTADKPRSVSDKVLRGKAEWAQRSIELIEPHRAKNCAITPHNRELFAA